MKDKSLNIAPLKREDEKQRIANAFDKGAPHYESQAMLQRLIGHQLLSSFSLEKGSRLLDAGCGTGYFSRYLKLLGHEVIACDLSSNMLRCAKQQNSAQHYLLADIEQLPFADNQLDGVFSNLVVQWSTDLTQTLNELCRVTKSGGKVVFSTLISGSLTQLEQSWQQHGLASPVNRFMTLKEIEAALNPLKEVSSLLWHHQSVTLHFPCFISLLQSLKGIGATHKTHRAEQGLMTPHRLGLIASAYPKRKLSPCYPLSYHWVYGEINVKKP